MTMPAMAATPLGRALRAARAVKEARAAGDRKAYDRASARLMHAVLALDAADRERYSRAMGRRAPLPMWPAP